jgi:hypothetical protein
MSDGRSPEPAVEVDSIEPEELKERIDGENVSTANVPYFEFLRNDEFDEDLVADLPDDREVTVLCRKVVATNLGHQQPSDRKAFSLELGPNNCAASQDAPTGD